MTPLRNWPAAAFSAEMRSLAGSGRDLRRVAIARFTYGTGARLSFAMVFPETSDTSALSMELYSPDGPTTLRMRSVTATAIQYTPSMTAVPPNS
jgi:hypothetical protein